ncbi:uncharacterized protein LOC126780936 isoform X2 [Nymphalis io]|uniref:uncharacterized protein LOC126780936 isoform X2 n=1 Tax=Inachis io TaxID=171585 RepID=UPI0021675C52|nr:uncharacterized protein LOC126780936 isoform X2 [Nymphalis io]
MALHDAPRALARTTYLGRLIVRSLTGDSQTDRARRGSCTPIKAQKCAPCGPKPRPACRVPSATCPHGVRLVCYPPSTGMRPPCDLTNPPPPLSCDYNKKLTKTTKHTEVQENGEQNNFCGAQLDRVAMRLAAAERLRRLDYEREVALQTPPPAPVPAPYQIAGEHECLRAIDGRDYTVSKLRNDTEHSTQDTPTCPVKLKPVDKCEISHSHHLDPCEHHPRIFLEIDRSTCNKSSNSISNTAEKHNDDSNTAKTLPPKQLSSTGRFTPRFLKSLKRTENSVCPRQVCRSSSNEKSWCVNLPPPKTVPASCKEQSLLERLRQRPGCMSGKLGNPQRHLHSKPCNEPPSVKPNIPSLQEKTKQDRLTTVLHERMQLKEAGRGRVVTIEQKSNKKVNIGSGGLELKVPPNSEAVRVRVSVDFETIDIATSKNDPAELKNYNGRAISSCIGGTDSWLSIKNLQNKFSGYRKNDVSSEIKNHGKNGTSQRPNNNKTSNSVKKPACILPPRSKKTVENSPHSNTSTLQTPRSQSPCSSALPHSKQTISPYISQNLLTS